LDYYHDISFNSFLFPNVKDTRKILAFLFEIMFKEDETEAQNQPSDTFEVSFKRRLVKFKAKPWVMPEFLKGGRPMFVGGGDKIIASDAGDLKRVAQGKSKKAKGVQFMMKALSA